MKRIMAIELVNGTVLQEEVTEEGEGLNDEEVLTKLAQYFNDAKSKGVHFAIYAGQMLAIDKVVEAYIQES